MLDMERYFQDENSFSLDNETGLYFRFMGNYFLVLEQGALSAINRLLQTEGLYVDFRLEVTQPILIDIEKNKAYKLVSGSGTVNQEFMTALRRSEEGGTLHGVYCSANNTPIPINSNVFEYLRGGRFELDYLTVLRSEQDLKTPVLIVFCIFNVDSELNKNVDIVIQKDNHVWKSKDWRS